MLHSLLSQVAHLPASPSTIPAASRGHFHPGTSSEPNNNNDYIAISLKRNINTTKLKKAHFLHIKYLHQIHRNSEALLAAIFQVHSILGFVNLGLFIKTEFGILKMQNPVFGSSSGISYMDLCWRPWIWATVPIFSAIANSSSVCLSPSYSCLNGSRYQNAFLHHTTERILEAKFCGHEFRDSPWRMNVLKRGIPHGKRKFDQ